jgi:glycine cleavage system H lipoate-binding protein
MRNAWDTQHELEDAAASDPLKCVWMLAGVVNYKLCDQQYDCEHCAFDRAMRQSVPSQVERVSPAPELRAESKEQRAESKEQVLYALRSPLSAQVQGYELAGSLFYHPNHIWARIEDGGRVRMGLDDFGQRLVGRIYSVHLPEPGMKVACGAGCWWVAHRAGETTLATPLTGIVHQINEQLMLRPSLINHDPYGEGWVMVLQPEHLMKSLEHLYYGQQAERWYGQEIEKLHQELRILVQTSRPDLGVTLQDGGSQIEDPARVIDASQLRQIIDTFLSATISGEQRAESEERGAVALSSKPYALRSEGGARR